jgi:uncharacterized protein
MSDVAHPTVGSIAWVDLTIENAEAIRDFYSHVVGWKAAPVEMPGYTDFNMIGPESLEPAAGICHARGVNADIPSQWLMYIIVEDVDHSARLCVEHGGRILSGPRLVAGAQLCIISDPAGAVCALYQPPAPAA